MSPIFKALLIAAFPATVFAQSNGYSDLTGQMVLTGKEVVDPPAGQKVDRVGLFLTGSSAEKIYSEIKAKPINGDACEQGLRWKKAGGLTCASHSDGSYECSVAILLKSGATKPIGAC